MPTILLVEDDEWNRTILVRSLTRYGYTVLTAATGNEARNLTTTALPEVVLMDLELPDLDGREVTRLLRANPATQFVPIIALTAYDMRDERESALQAGCNDFHAKPVKIERLLQQIADLLPKGDA